MLRSSAMRRRRAAALVSAASPNIRSNTARGLISTGRGVVSVRHDRVLP